MDPVTTTGSDPAELRATSRQTKFSLAANHDPDLVPRLASYPIDEVYSKFPTDGTSGGCPRHLAAQLSEAYDSPSATAAASVEVLSLANPFRDGAS